MEVEEAIIRTNAVTIRVGLINQISNSKSIIRKI